MFLYTEIRCEPPAFNTVFYEEKHILIVLNGLDPKMAHVKGDTVAPKNV